MNSREEALITTDAQAVAMLERLDRSPLIGFDCESSGPLLYGKDNPNKKNAMLNTHLSTLTGMSFDDGGKSWYLPIAHVSSNAPKPVVRKVADAFAGRKKVVAIHNLKHELLALRKSPHVAHLPQLWYEQLREGGHNNLICTQVLCWLACMPDDGGGYGLKGLAKTYLGKDRPSFKEATQGRSFSELKPQEALSYACQDAADAYDLCRLAFPKVTPSRKLLDWFWDVEMPCVGVLRHMEDSGMGISRDVLEGLSGTLAAKAEEARAEFEFETGASPASWKQLQPLFGDVWKASGAPKNPSGEAFGTDAYAMEWQLARLPADSRGAQLIRLRQAFMTNNKMASTYGVKLLNIAEQYDDLRIHGGTNHTGARTGRFSSSDPNMQNIPVRSEEGKAIRRAFVAKPGHKLLGGDYSQIELRVMAHATGHGKLYDGFLAGADPHQLTADLVGKSRDVGKTCNFAIIYRVGAKTLSTGDLKCSLKEAKDILSKMKAELSDEEARLEEYVSEARRCGSVTMISGRKRAIPLLPLENLVQDLEDSGHRYNASAELREAIYQRGRAQRQAANTPEQGGAADIVKKAMVDMWRTLDLSQTMMVNQVHDDIMQEAEESYVTEAMEIQRVCMTEAWDLRVPLLVDQASGDNWAELK